ncbi:MAG: hypothetical protein J6Y77_07195 [Paludibacteraceae bacterium]|nr:hypothetical protein [Paludibacteraceae bacterium]
MKSPCIKRLAFTILWSAFFGGMFAASPAKTPPVQYNGLEVSAENGNVNWTSVAKDPQIEVVYIRATNGKELDPMFKKNLAKVKKTSLKVGFVLHMNTNSSVKSQYDVFVANVSPEDCDVFPIVLVDENKNWGKKFAENLSWMISYLTDRYGGAIIYTTEAFYNKQCNTELNNSLPLLLAKPGKKEPVIKNAPAGTSYLLWLFDKKGTVKGLQTAVNLIRFHEGKGMSWLLIPKKKETEESGE